MQTWQKIPQIPKPGSVVLSSKALPNKGGGGPYHLDKNKNNQSEREQGRGQHV